MKPRGAEFPRNNNAGWGRKYLEKGATVPLNVSLVPFAS